MVVFRTKWIFGTYEGIKGEVRHFGRYTLSIFLSKVKRINSTLMYIKYESPASSRLA